MASTGIYSSAASPDLERLVQNRLKIANQRFPALAPNSDNNVRSVAYGLPSTADKATVKKLVARREAKSEAQVSKDNERALDWARFLAAVRLDQSPSQRTLLFRAHDQPATDQSGVYTSAALTIPFDDEYRQRNSVRQFLTSLEMHLGKNTKEVRAKGITKTEFTSTSPKLEWTLHLTSKKSLRLQAELHFVIFDLQALRQAPETTVLHVADVLKFLQTSNQTDLIPAKYREWAENCDEYVIMGRGIEEGIVQMTPWSKLQDMGIFNFLFCHAGNLDRYRNFREQRVGRISWTSYEQVCRMVVLTARTIAGQKAEDTEFVKHIIDLILKPSLRFWDIYVNRGDAEVARGCKELLEDGSAARLSQVSV